MNLLKEVAIKYADELKKVFGKYVGIIVSSRFKHSDDKDWIILFSKSVDCKWYIEKNIIPNMDGWLCTLCFKPNEILYWDHSQVGYNISYNYSDDLITIMHDKLESLGIKHE